jgi:sugar phosphate isomerase/epimerase
MLLVRPIHEPEFLSQYELGVETHITRDDIKEGYEKYIPFVHGVHLPYKDVNLAAFDPEERRAGVEHIKKCVETGSRYPVDRMVMHPCGTLSFQGVECGTYAPVVDCLREIADFMAQKGLILCLENQLYKPIDVRVVVGCHSEEWFQLYHDINRPNVKLTFDSSHAASCAAEEEDDEKRLKALWRYLEHPDYIGRFHWSDSRITGGESLFNDMHLVPGQGDLPREFHQAIKALDCVKTLEQRVSDEEHIFSFEFIDSL